MAAVCQDPNRGKEEENFWGERTENTYLLLQLRLVLSRVFPSLNYVEVLLFKKAGLASGGF